MILGFKIQGVHRNGYYRKVYHPMTFTILPRQQLHDFYYKITELSNNHYAINDTIDIYGQHTYDI